MTVNDYISQKFQTFGINLSEADLLEISLSSGISGEDEMNQSNIGLVSVAMAKFIPSLLLRATSVSENGFSMSWDTKGVKEYYSFLCKKYGLEDTLSDKPKVRFWDHKQTFPGMFRKKGLGFRDSLFPLVIFGA